MPTLKNQKHEAKAKGAKPAAIESQLDNLAHEKFAQAVAEGMSATAAYRAHVAEPGSTTETCMCNSSKLMADTKVKQRVAELRKDFREVLEQQLGVRRETIARKLMEIIETPVEEVANTTYSPLAQKIKRKRIYTGQGEEKEEWETEEVESSSRMDAIKELNKMAGFHAPEQTEQKLEIVISKL